MCTVSSGVYHNQFAGIYSYSPFYVLLIFFLISKIVKQDFLM
jgi:hypothetical protein